MKNKLIETSKWIAFPLTAVILLIYFWNECKDDKWAAIGQMGSFIVAAITYPLIFLQLRAIKNNEYATQRPFVAVSIENSYSLPTFVIKNCGITSAKNITLRASKEEIKVYNNLGCFIYGISCLTPQTQLQYPLTKGCKNIHDAWLTLQSDDTVVTVEYEDVYSNKYQESYNMNAFHQQSIGELTNPENNHPGIKALTGICECLKDLLKKLN